MARLVYELHDVWSPLRQRGRLEGAAVLRIRGMAKSRFKAAFVRTGPG